jgi:Thioester domain
MRKLLVLAAGMVLLSAGLAQAMNTFTIGSAYSYPIYMMNGSTPVTYGAGSFDTSSLNGSSLAYLYCVDLGNTITPGQTYNNTGVTTNGFVHGSRVNNAIQVAWLLHTYGVNGQGDAAIALQASIWHVIDPTTISLDTTKASLSQIGYYNSYLGTIPNTNIPDYLNNFVWISPGTVGNSTVYQGEVAPVPIPSALLLFGSALLGLVGIGRKLKM